MKCDGCERPADSSGGCALHIRSPAVSDRETLSSPSPLTWLMNVPVVSSRKRPRITLSSASDPGVIDVQYEHCLLIKAGWGLIPISGEHLISVVAFLELAV